MWSKNFVFFSSIVLLAILEPAITTNVDKSSDRDLRSLTTPLKSPCPSSYFDCGDGNCVSYIFLCDGEPDCPNAADEKCDGAKHVEKKFHCEEGKFSCPGIDICLPNKWKCDGHDDCPNGFDEKNCTSTVKCDGFHCKSGECIPERWRCDNNFDCSDGSDEENCKSSRINANCIRENGQFECASGLCIEHDKVCDGHNDCPGGDDEGKFCAINGCHAKNCTHGCFQTPQGPQCDCNPGYKLNQDDKRTCMDIDECASSNSNICSQKCENTLGSFRCYCDAGYKLVNQTKCEVQTSEPVLIYTDSHSVRGYWMKRKLHFQIALGFSHAFGVDMHRESKLVFWTDIGTNSSHVFSAHFDNKDVKVVVASGLQKPEDIAIDYVANNLYITDAGLKQIIVCKIDGSSCAPIVTRFIDTIRAIALDVARGRMFWTDWGEKPGIFTARMDGSGVRALVNRDIIWPNGLTYDKHKNRIYWSDAKLERIEYFDLNTRKRFVLIDDTVYHPHCLTMFEDNLYWADWESYSVSRSNKFTGHNMTDVFRRSSVIYGMHIYHPVNYAVSTNPCWSASCSHLCLITSPNTAKCACPNNMKLDPKDPTTCIERDDSFSMILGLDHTIKKVWPNNIGKDITQQLVKKMPLEIDSANEYAFKQSSDELFLHNANKAGIAKFNVKTQEYSLIYDKNVSSIFGLTYDDFSDNLYWLDTQFGHLVVASVDGRKQILLLDNLQHPSSLALYQEHNELFVGLMGDHPLIMVADLDGKNSKVLIDNIGLPSSLAICKTHDLLYWSDSKRGTIESISIKTSGVYDPSSRRTVLSGLGQVASLIIKDQVLYWTDTDSTFLHKVNLKDEKKAIRKISIGGIAKAHKKLTMVYKRTTPNDCLTMKDKCSDICLFGGFKTINGMKVPLTHCECPSGSSLSNDKRTCEVKQHCPAGWFTCHSTKTCIRSSEVCDGHKNCPNNEDEIGCPEVKPCPFEHSRCDPNDLKSECIANAWFCDGDKDCENGFDELNCHNASAKTIYSDVAHKSTVNGACETGYFKCDQDICIPWHFVCNGELNCADKTDEGANCLEHCSCKNNGKCYMNSDNVWACQCPPNWEGRDCEIPRDLSARSDDTHKIVMKESMFTKGRFSSSDEVFPSNRTDGGTFWLVMLLVVIVLLISGLVIGGYVYMYETDGRLYVFKRNLIRRMNLGNESFRSKNYDYNSATADLLDQMEGDHDDDDEMDPKKFANQNLVC